jgi:hypothetical protein
LNDNSASEKGARMQFQNFNDTFANEGPLNKPSPGIHFVGSYANLMGITFYSAPLSIEGNVTGDIRNSILSNSNYCLGQIDDGHSNVQSPTPPDPCCIDSILRPGISTYHANRPGRLSAESTIQKRQRNRMMVTMRDDGMRDRYFIRLGLGIALSMLLGLAISGPAAANNIEVTSPAQLPLSECTLANAITAHNRAAKVCGFCQGLSCIGCCAAGSGSGSDDILIEVDGIFLDSNLPAVEQGTVNLKAKNVSSVALHGAYFTVNHGAELTINDQISDSTGLFGEFTESRSMFDVFGGGTLTFKGSGSFTDHGTSLFAKPAKTGGVIFNYRGSVTMKGDSQFNGNNATEAGGVIYNDGGTVMLALQKYALRDNSAPLGGVIYSTGGGTVEATGLTMSANSARDGSCIFTRDGRVKLSFTTCKDSKGSPLGRGGGLTAERSEMTIDASLFSNNHEGDQNASGGWAALSGWMTAPAF